MEVRQDFKHMQQRRSGQLSSLDLLAAVGRKWRERESYYYLSLMHRDTNTQRCTLSVQMDGSTFTAADVLGGQRDVCVCVNTLWEGYCKHNQEYALCVIGSVMWFESCLGFLLFQLFHSSAVQLILFRADISRQWARGGVHLRQVTSSSQDWHVETDKHTLAS